MMVDLLRACKTKKVYWDKERTKSSTILWYFCEPGAKVFPGPNIFTSETWDETHWYGGPIGEDYATGPKYYSGKKPGTPVAKQPCGELDWFADGPPKNAPPLARNEIGLPSCCFADARLGYGCRCQGTGTPTPLPPENYCAACINQQPPPIWVLTSTNDVYTLFNCPNCPMFNNQSWNLVYKPLNTPLKTGNPSDGCTWESDFFDSPCPDWYPGPLFWQAYLFDTGIFGNTQLILFDQNLGEVMIASQDNPWDCTSQNSLFPRTWFAGNQSISMCTGPTKWLLDPSGL